MPHREKFVKGWTHPVMATCLNKQINNHSNHPSDSGKKALV